jgi:hypothetical protein
VYQADAVDYLDLSVAARDLGLSDSDCD